MQSFQEFLETVFQFIATVEWIFFWLLVAGGLSYFAYLVLRMIRRYFEEQYEAEMIREWHKRNQMIAAAAHDLDHPDELQRELAEYYITLRLP